MCGVETHTPCSYCCRSFFLLVLIPLFDQNFCALFLHENIRDRLENSHNSRFSIFGNLIRRERMINGPYTTQNTVSLRQKLQNGVTFRTFTDGIHKVKLVWYLIIQYVGFGADLDDCGLRKRCFSHRPRSVAWESIPFSRAHSRPGLQLIKLAYPRQRMVGSVNSVTTLLPPSLLTPQNFRINHAMCRMQCFTKNEKLPKTRQAYCSATTVNNIWLNSDNYSNTVWGAIQSRSMVEQWKQDNVQANLESVQCRVFQICKVFDYQYCKSRSRDPFRPPLT